MPQYVIHLVCIMLQAHARCCYKQDLPERHVVTECPRRLSCYAHFISRAASDGPDPSSVLGQLYSCLKWRGGLSESDPEPSRSKEKQSSNAGERQADPEHTVRIDLMYHMLILLPVRPPAQGDIGTQSALELRACCCRRSGERMESGSWQHGRCDRNPVHRLHWSPVKLE